MSFIFDATKGETPASVARRRAIVQELMGGIGTPNDVGSGLSALGHGIAAGVLNRRADAAEQAGMEHGQQSWSEISKLLSDGGDNVDIGRLTELSGDPWLSDSQREIAQLLYKKKLDPSQGEDFFGNTIPYEDADGNVHYGQIGNRGTFKPIDMGEGNKALSPTKTVNTKTEQITYDRYGNELFRTPINNQEAARDTKIGQGEGEAVLDYQSLASKMPGLEHVVTQLDQLADQATYTWSGTLTDDIRRQMGAEPRDSAVARQTYISMVDNQILPLLRDTFGAQFTEREGASLRATLGNPDLHPKEKQAVLKAFIEQKRRDVEALAARTGNAQPAAPAPEETWVRGPDGKIVRGP